MKFMKELRKAEVSLAYAQGFADGYAGGGPGAPPSVEEAEKKVAELMAVWHHGVQKSIHEKAVAKKAAKEGK